MPKVSVIIPVYNVEKYIRQALDSVINQTLEDIEIICVNDCTPDKSFEIVKEYASKDERFVLLEQEYNQGQGAARNRGLDIAKGDYIMFLDPDDWYDLNACELAYNQIKTNKNDYVTFCFYNYINKTGIKKVDTLQIKPFASVINKPNIKLWELNNPIITAAFTVMAIYDKNFLYKYNIKYDETVLLGEDANFYFKALCNANSISILNKPLYYYRRHKNSTSNKKSDLWREHFKSRMQALQIISQSSHADIYLKSYLFYFINSTLNWYDNWTKYNLWIRKDLYNFIRQLFINIKNKYNIESVKEFMNSDKIKSFDNVINESWEIHFYKSIINAFFSIKSNDTTNSNKLIITFLRMKFSINKNKFNKLFIRYSQKRVLRQIKKKVKNGRKIRVIFLSNEISKWNASSLYWELEKSELFEPLILVQPLIRVHNCEDFSQPSLEEQYNFYKCQGMNVEYSYKNGEYINLKEFSPDIVFYQQNWSLPANYKVEYVSKFALPCYFTYGMEILNSVDGYMKNFHKLLFKYFVDCDFNIKRYESYNRNNSKNCIALGLPKLDVYLDNKQVNTNKYWKDASKIKIIYAPHHSFENDGLNFATFKENGMFIQELAKKHPETTWIFKPHPRFRYALFRNNIMTEAEIDNYYNTWAEIGNIFTGGEYFDIFKSSDLMITDCCSFLGEYLPTKKPLIRLLNSKAMTLNSMGERITSEYYISHNNDELKNFFETVVVEKNDYKKENRIKIASEFVNDTESAAKRICNYLDKIIKGE